MIKEEDVYRNKNEWPRSVYLWICSPGERPFHCETCKRSFSRGDKLQMHLRIHSGVKPHHCDQCDYATVDSGSLRKHMRIHNDERPYKWVYVWYGCIIFLWIKILCIWFSPSLEEANVSDVRPVTLYTKARQWRPPPPPPQQQQQYICATIKTCSRNIGCVNSAHMFVQYQSNLIHNFY